MLSKPLPFNESEIRDIIRDFPTPFHIYDEKGIVDNIIKVHKAFEWNKGYKQYFAVKALPNPEIMRILKDNNCGMDCASISELRLSEYLGVVGDNIMFSSNETPAEDYIYARKLGAIINLDDISHIDFLEKNGGIPETICCRYNPGKFAMTNDIMGNLYDSKFGMTKEQIIKAFSILKQKGAKRFGIHAMLMSCELEESYYPMLSKLLFELAIDIKNTVDVDISFIDLAGGVGIPYKPEDKALDIIKIGDEVRKVYDEVIKPSGLDISIFTEMGRFITGPYGYLVTEVIHKKDIYKQYLGVDATACNLMRPAIYGAYHHITIMGKENNECTHTYDVTGSLCENNDKFAQDRNLPQTEIGDILVIHDTGAHGYSMGYNYNGKLKSAEVLFTKEKNAKLIRKAETVNDYFSTLRDIYPGLVK